MSRGIQNEVGETIKAGCVVFDGDGKLLLAKDSARDYPFWSLPKGHIEAGEDAEEAAVRETLEETGWRVDVIRPLGDLLYVSPVSGDPVLLHLYLAEPVELLEKSEAHEIPGWFAPSELDGKLYPDTIKFLRQQKLI